MAGDGENREGERGAESLAWMLPVAVMLQGRACCRRRQVSSGGAAVGSPRDPSLLPGAGGSSEAWSPAEGPGGEAGFYTGNRASVGGDGTNQGAI